jgi:lysophospholipase L1-like esterase
MATRRSTAGIVGAALALQFGHWLCEGWMRGDGPFKALYVHRVARSNKRVRRGGIVIYGSSNIRTWTSIAEDLAPFTVVNRGFGGATDADLLQYAGRLLYPLFPAVACVHTGSEDLARGLRPTEVLLFKRRMLATFRERLADTTFVVTAALPLPGRAHDWPASQAVNEALREYCQTHRDMVFADATPALTTRSGYFRPELFHRGGVRLNRAGQRAWASALLPALARATASSR